MRGTQTLAAASTNQDHPLSSMANHTLPPRNLKTKTTPHRRYVTEILSSLPPCPPNTSLKKHIHRQITHRSINSLKDNTLLQARPPEIHPSESELPHSDRVLRSMRCGHHLALMSYQKRLDDAMVDAFPECNASPHSVSHIMEHCTSYDHLKTTHNIHSVRDLWDCPVQAAAFLRETGPGCQNVLFHFDSHPVIWRSFPGER